jgi:hypothetical protein
MEQIIMLKMFNVFSVKALNQLQQEDHHHRKKILYHYIFVMNVGWLVEEQNDVVPDLLSTK